MIDDLIKRCQENIRFKSCEECGYNCNDEYDEFLYLQELVVKYNEKYGVNYAITDYDKLIRIKELINEC